MPGGTIPYTPKGLAFDFQWGSIRLAMNSAFVAVVYSDKACVSCSASKRQAYASWAASQLHYALGSTGRSFVVGYGVNPPVRPHHRGASCVIGVACSIGFSSPNPHVIEGALVGGPGSDDSYADVRTDYVKNEVALDYNAAFSGVVARFVAAAA